MNRQTFFRAVSKAGRAFRYVGIVLFIALILMNKFNLAGIIGIAVFFASYLFRTDETGETPMERRSYFEKLCGLEPEEDNKN